MSNSHIDKSYKNRLRSCARKGKDSVGPDTCRKSFPCQQLDFHAKDNNNY